MWGLLARDRDFRLLWSGQLLSSVGSWLLVVAVPLYVYDLTGSSVATGAAYVAEMLPVLVVGPLAGVFADRWDKRRTMITVDVVRAVLVAALLVVDRPGRLWVLYLVLVAENAASQVFQPARQALIPALVGRAADLTDANALYSVINAVVRIAGAGLGGVVYLTAGFEVMVAVDVASYLASALLCARLAHRGPGAALSEASVGAVLGDLREGWAQLRSSPLLGALLVINAGYFVVNGALTALLVPFTRATLHASSAQVGYLLAGLGAGYLAGAPLARRAVGDHTPRRVVVAALAGVSACFLAAFTTSTYPVTLVALTAAGIPGVVLLVAVGTYYQRQAPEAVLGRVSAVFVSTEMAASLIGATTASLLSPVVGTRTVLVTACAALVAVTTLAWQVLPPAPAPTSTP